MRNIIKVLCGGLLMPNLVMAESGYPLINDDLNLTLGVFYPYSSTGAALAPASGGVGAVIDFENTLDLEKRRAGISTSLFWRFTEHWRLHVDYFDIRRDASRALSADLTWGDKTFSAGSRVDTNYDFSDLSVRAEYAFFQKEDKELGIGVGLHAAGIKASIEASDVGAEAADVTAPLPVMSLYGMFGLTSKWALQLRADWLSMSYGDYAGDIRNSEINAVYQPVPHFGVGAGVRNMVIDLEIDRSDWRGKSRISSQGPTVFMVGMF